METCEVCAGSGAKVGSKRRICSTCGGRGQVMRTEQTPFGLFSQGVELRAVRARLDELLKTPFDASDIAEKQALQIKFQELLTQEETVWIQRSRALWLKGGDRNTAYFHRRASNRRQRNQILGLFDDTGRWVNEPHEIERVVTTYYQNLFLTEGSNPMARELILNTVQPKVSMVMNQELMSPYSDEEVRVAIFQMHPSKSPGPDGMSPFFFQKG
ncbi:hypothetical protein ABKV19_008789 [Rosa sericea]